jgi:hypothetical protein
MPAVQRAMPPLVLQQVRAVNKATGNPATRYIHPNTGQSVVIDDVTGQVTTSVAQGSSTDQTAGMSRDLG